MARKNEDEEARNPDDFCDFDSERPISEERSGTGTFTVLVDDNYHYMDEDARYQYGVFATAEEAIAACKAIVERCLQEAFEPGMGASALLSQYRMFGDDPFIVPSGGFSAWDYAEKRCAEIATKQTV